MSLNRSYRIHHYITTISSCSLTQVKMDAAAAAAAAEAREEKEESVKREVADLVAKHSDGESKSKEQMTEAEVKLQKPSMGSFFGL